MALLASALLAFVSGRGWLFLASLSPALCLREGMASLASRSPALCLREGMASLASRSPAFSQTCETAIQLREKGKVVVADTTLQYLGSVHLKSGVLDPHFEVVKEALVRTLKEGLGEKYNEEVEGAWSQAYDHLALAIKAEMKQEDSQKP